jgi:PAS domain S-box-containing protein
MNINETGTGKIGPETGQTGKSPDRNLTSFHNERSFRQAMENSIPSGIAVIDEKGRQVFVNHSFCKMLGWEEDELIGKEPPYVYWPAEETKNIMNVFGQTLNNSAPAEGFDLVFRHKNGNNIPVNINISAFTQEDNQTFYLANVIDISERKKTEEELMKSKVLLMSSIESQKETIIFSTDQNYHYMYFNKAHWDSMKFAYGSDIKTGMSILDCITSESDRKVIRNSINSALKGVSGSHIRTFGEVNLAYYESFFNPIIDENKKVIGCTVLARNITARINAEKALRESEIKLRAIINQINDTILVFDEQGKIIIWNRGAEMMCGLKAEEALNKSIIDVQVQLTPPPGNNREVIEKVINGIIKFEMPERLNQIIESEILVPGSGKRRDIQSMIFPIRLEGENLFCTVIRDTTEIKRYEKELLRVSSEKDKFYSIVAQYLYTPFNVFNSFSRLMAEELDNLPIREIQKMTGMMSKSATNLYGILDNLLQWTRMNQGKIPFDPQKLNFRNIGLDAVSILKPQLDSKNIKISHTGDDEVYVSADSFMLKTILRNLISYAINIVGNDGQIDIDARKSDSLVTVSVWFSGPGLASPHLTRLFDISQIDSASGSAEEKGSTLGLLLCKEFVEKHGGKIWAENGNDNRDEFKFTLPVFV